jgi:2-polyprenylphenol 6-hydroxylase
MTETAQPISHFEVIVVGGGMVGAALAALLGQAGVAVALLDARPEPLAADEVGKGQPAMRVSALTPISQRLLERPGRLALDVGTPGDALSVHAGVGQRR